MKRVIGAAIAAAALIALSSAAVTAQDVCGPAGEQYRCGGILVILKADTSDSIGDVIERMGGDPTGDILQEFTAVRDLLDPDGVADDMSEATVYSVAVPVGQEEAMAAAYAADPAVYAAAVDRETIGSTTPPDTAMAAPTVGWLASVGSVLVVIGGVLALMKRRS